MKISSTHHIARTKHGDVRKRNPQRGITTKRVVNEIKKMKKGGRHESTFGADTIAHELGVSHTRENYKKIGTILAKLSREDKIRRGFLSGRGVYVRGEQRGGI